jgi:hypothetical protein
MHPNTNNWQPARIQDISTIIGGFKPWCLCGGQSLDLLIGYKTREHGDTDIGVFRSDLSQCLSRIDPERVFLCGPLRPWDGGEVSPTVHSVWITDDIKEQWVLQILVYDDDGVDVIYRRDPRVRWNKAYHAISIGEIQILNPVITLLFKCNRHEMEDKDVNDLHALIEEMANKAMQSDARTSRR